MVGQQRHASKRRNVELRTWKLSSLVNNLVSDIPSDIIGIIELNEMHFLDLTHERLK